VRKAPKNPKTYQCSVGPYALFYEAGTSSTEEHRLAIYICLKVGGGALPRKSINVAQEQFREHLASLLLAVLLFVSCDRRSTNNIDVMMACKIS